MTARNVNSIDAFERRQSIAPTTSEEPCGTSGFRKRARPCRSPDRLQDRGFEARARQITGGAAVELILDAIDGDSLKKGYRLLAPTGKLGMFGVSSGANNKTGGMFGRLSMLASTPWLQFNPCS